MNSPHYIGFDVHKKHINFCIKAGDLPAVSRWFGDCAKEFLLPMLPSVCFETGRFTLTQSSWTALLLHCSRKLDVWPSSGSGPPERSLAAVHFFLSNVSGVPERREISAFP